MLIPKPNLNRALEEAFEASRNFNGCVALLIAYPSYSKYPNHEAVKEKTREMVNNVSFMRELRE